MKRFNAFHRERSGVIPIVVEACNEIEAIATVLVLLEPNHAIPTRNPSYMVDLEEVPRTRRIAPRRKKGRYE